MKIAAIVRSAALRCAPLPLMSAALGIGFWSNLSHAVPSKDTQPLKTRHEAAAPSPSANAAEPSDVCKIAAETIKNVASIRKLSIKSAVPCIVNDREQVKSYILETISSKLPSGKLQFEESAYKAIGFIPEDYDYPKAVVDLYVSQIGGYYDPEKKRYVMAAWMPEIMQTTVAAHELTHALQDQHFNLSSYVDPKIDNSDALLARSAVVEGDATAVMLDYTRQMVGQPPLSKEKNVEGFMLQNVMGAAFSGSMGEVPESLQLLLLFPYTSGLRFAHTQMIKSGYAGVDVAFRVPPRSTEEILHPEKYGVKTPDFVTFRDSDLRSVGVLSDAVAVYQDVVGEFATSALLGMYLEDKHAVAEAAAGWGGDLVSIFDRTVEKEVHRTIVWRSRWDSPSDKEQFERALRQVIAERYPASLAPKQPVHADTSQPVTESGLGEGWFEGARGARAKISEIEQDVQLVIILPARKV